MLLLFAYHCHSLRPLCMWDTALSYSFMFCSCNVTVLSALSHVQNISLLCILSLAPSLYVGCCFMLYVILCFVLVMLLFFTPFPLLCSIFHYCMPSLAPSLWDVLLYVILCSFMFVCPFPMFLCRIFHCCMPSLGMLLYVLLCFVLVMLLSCLPFPMCRIFHYCAFSPLPSYQLEPAVWWWSLLCEGGFYYCDELIRSEPVVWWIFLTWWVNQRWAWPGVWRIFVGAYAVSVLSL